MQQQLSNNTTPQYGMQQGMDRVQRLKMERNYMLERQQQLQQQGLLDQQQSPHQAVQPQYGSPPCHSMGSPYESAPSTVHNSYQLSNSIDNQMEVDYQQNIPPEPMIDTASIVQVSPSST